jgi:hypothetical protein
VFGLVTWRKRALEEVERSGRAAMTHCRYDTEKNVYEKVKDN